LFTSPISENKNCGIGASKVDGDSIFKIHLGFVIGNECRNSDNGVNSV
jgi:hypothetical protein